MATSYTVTTTVPEILHWAISIERCEFLQSQNRICDFATPRQRPLWPALGLLRSSVGRRWRSLW